MREVLYPISSHLSPFLPICVWFYDLFDVVVCCRMLSLVVMRCCMVYRSTVFHQSWICRIHCSLKIFFNIELGSEIWSIFDLNPWNNRYQRKFRLFVCIGPSGRIGHKSVCKGRITARDFFGAPKTGGSNHGPFPMDFPMDCLSNHRPLRFVGIVIPGPPNIFNTPKHETMFFFVGIFHIGTRQLGCLILEWLLYNDMIYIYIYIILGIYCPIGMMDIH